MDFWTRWSAGQNSSVESRDSPAYFYRMRYRINISVMELPYQSLIKTTAWTQYRFVRMYPVNVDTIPISYDQSQLLRLMTFKYERYIPGYNILNTSFNSGSEKYSSNLSGKYNLIVFKWFTAW